MGWTYQHEIAPIDRRKLCRREINTDKYEVVKDAVVGTTWYAAIRNKETGKIHADIVLTKIDRSGYCNFGMKWLSEDCGPFKCDCPKSILDLLSPTDNEYALEWRENCRKGRTEKIDWRKIPVGAKLRVTLIGGEERTVIKMAPAYQFKTWWLLVDGSNSYIPKSRVKMAEVI